MIWTDTKRIIQAGFVGFWRNNFVSLASILVMTVTLFVIGSLIFINVMLDSALTIFRDKVDVNVYFTTTASEEDILAVKTQLEGLAQVSRVEYISKEDALTRFKARHEGDQLMLQALEELNENPLGAALSIKAKEPSQYEGIAAYLSDDTNALSKEGKPVIDEVNYFKNKVAIDRLSSLIKSAETFGLIVTIVLVIASILITFTTIRLAIYTSRDEITIMRLVGASNHYIRGPFVFQGIMYGAISGLITLIIFYPLALTFGSKTREYFDDSIDLFVYYTHNFGILFVILVGTGILLGAVSSYLAVKRYLTA